MTEAHRGRRHASASDDDDVRNRSSRHIVELSEMIVSEIDSNTWVSSPTTKTTIFRAPTPRGTKLLIAADKSTYQPSFLSIGPYHCGDNATAEMRRNEQGKLWAADFILRSGEGEGPAVVEYAEAVASMEPAARSCYEGDVGMHQDAFCRMLLLDSCQLILLLLKFFAGAADNKDGGGGGGATGDPPPSSFQLDSCCKSKKWFLWWLRWWWRWLRRRQTSAGDGTDDPCSSSAAPLPAAGTDDADGSHGSAAAERSVKTRDICMTVHDLMMLENQIPFFVVEKVYQLRFGDATAARSLAWEAMRGIMGGIPPAPGGRHCLDDDDNKAQHLVHVCHLYLKPTCLVNEPQKTYLHMGKYGRFQRATEYYDAGVKFRRWGEAGGAGGGRLPMLDVRFTSGAGVLSMALQTIDESTGYILANVLAYEQKYYRAATSADSNYVTAYVVFMTQLLGDPDDVALLSSRGVMEHHLGTDAEVCALFRGLADGLFFDPAGGHYLTPVAVALQRHCQYRPNRWRAWIVRHRFGNPWLGAAWVFGAFAVLCTVIQTVFTVLSYVKQA